MTIWIDADGCPVVQATIALAKEKNIPVTAVKNHAIELYSDYATIITVDVSSDSADLYIVNHLSCGDLVITQDLGLAALVLSKQGKCLTPNGKSITHDNIDLFLDFRHASGVQRKKTGRGSKVKKRTTADDDAFLWQLMHMVNASL